ncbi:MAG TPA: BamA/TamA family outer membrane protein [Polyangiales bacterium]|nr:BamA/TamA family outer membrane protein [Polyangiales bacterium]
MALPAEPSEPAEGPAAPELDPETEPEEQDSVSPGGAPIRYRLEDIRVKSQRTRSGIVAGYVPIKKGARFDVSDPSLEEVRWRLIGTGWFDEVKLSLARGSRRGWVILEIEVKERNTLLIDQFATGLSRVVSSSTATQDVLRPYVGLGLVETNLFGQGVSLSGTFVLTPQQTGLHFGYFDPRFANSGFSLAGRVFHNYAREFFGKNPLVTINCPVPPPGEADEDDDKCDPDVESKRAVVIYHRTGIGLGTGHEISTRLRYRLDWLGEYINVLSKPEAASTQRGSRIEPIDFRILDGQSIVSSLRFGLIYDNRDHPALPTSGLYVDFNARFATHLLGSSYDFARFELWLRRWIPLPWGHVLSAGLFMGSVFGNAPFFYNFYAADLSDLLPSRVLELNLDRRRTLNLLGTSIVEMDMEDLAARLDLQYQLPLHRGVGFVRGVDAYVGAGVFLLTRREDLRVGIPGYHGLSRLPIDLTFDLGVQADTEIGLFKLGFSTLIGFSPLGRESL